MTKSYGFISSLKGTDVIQNIDPQNILFSSKYSTLKVFDKNVISITTDGSGFGSTQIAHNLGFSPTFQVFRIATAHWQRANPSSIDNNNYPSSYISNPGNSSNWVSYHATCDVNSDNIYLNINITGAPGTTYYFLYYIFADLSDTYNQEILGNHSFGIATSQAGTDVLSNKLFQRGFTSGFRPLKYNKVKSGTLQLTLPKLFASQVDTAPEEACYGEVLHGLGYPPFFLGFAKSDKTLPLNAFESNMNFLDFADNPNWIVDSWCDATRVRFSFWRSATYLCGEHWDIETITIKYLVFDEDLTQFT